jgi:hypothetical protein
VAAGTAKYYGAGLRTGAASLSSIVQFRVRLLTPAIWRGLNGESPSVGFSTTTGVPSLTRL